MEYEIIKKKVGEKALEFKLSSKGVADLYGLKGSSIDKEFAKERLFIEEGDLELKYIESILKLYIYTVSPMLSISTKIPYEKFEKPLENPNIQRTMLLLEDLNIYEIIKIRDKVKLYNSKKHLVLEFTLEEEVYKLALILFECEMKGLTKDARKLFYQIKSLL